MNIKLNALCLGGFMALTAFLAQPVMADEWNKKTEFEFSGPVQVPGKVLAPGKYVFQLVDSEADRNIVQIFSENSNGKDTLVATLMVIPDYMENTPDKPIIHFDERPAGAPEAIHSWFYPGQNTGWEFVYPTEQAPQITSNVAAAPAPVETAAAQSLPPAPAEEAPAQEEMTTAEEELIVATPDLPGPASTPEADSQTATGAPVLPETGGFSSLEFITALAMLGGGVAIVFTSRRKSIA